MHVAGHSSAKIAVQLLALVGNVACRDPKMSLRSLSSVTGTRRPPVLSSVTPNAV